MFPALPNTRPQPQSHGAPNARQHPHHPQRSRPVPRPQGRHGARRAHRNHTPSAGGRGAGLRPLLGCGASQPRQLRRHQPRNPHWADCGAHAVHSRGQRRRYAAPLQRVQGGGSVPHAGDAVSRQNRPRRRARARQRPDDRRRALISAPATRCAPLSPHSRRYAQLSARQRCRRPSLRRAACRPRRRGRARSVAAGIARRQRVYGGGNGLALQLRALLRACVRTRADYSRNVSPKLQAVRLSV